jgi:hypothetical protein
MEFYLYKILYWIGQYAFELICFSIGVFFWAVADHYRDRVPEDSGFWSHKTTPDKFDIWHLSKRISLGAFAVGALGFTDIYYLINNVYIWAIVLAWGLQKMFYNGIFKWYNSRWSDTEK